MQTTIQRCWGTLVLWALLHSAATAATNLLSEGFNSGSMPAGWTTNKVADPGADPAITFVTSSTYEVAAPYEGTHFVKFNSWDCASNAESRLCSPAFSTIGRTNIALTFAWRQDARTGRDGEGVTLQWSANGTTWSNLAPFHMRRGSPTNWILKTRFLPPAATGLATVQVGFLFHSQYGNNCYLDDVRVTALDPINAFPYSEGFESGFGEWAQGENMDFGWTRWSGLTPSGEYAGQTTGVSSAHGGSFYIYTEASDPNYPAKAAGLEAVFDFSQLAEPRLWFYYHMCGAQTGTNYVEVSTNGGATWILAWSKGGQQQANETDPWAWQSVNLSAYGGRRNVRIRFRGVTGSGGLGDMAIDDISVTESVSIKSQSFDGVDANPWSYTGSPSASISFSASKQNSGTYALRIAGTSAGTNDPYVDFENVNIAAYTNVSLLVPFAASGPDSGDDLHVMVSYDNGASWSGGGYGVEVADGEPTNNLNLNFTEILGARTPQYCNPYNLAIPGDKSQIKVRVRFFDANGSNNTNDFYYIDDIKLVGRPIGSGVDYAICVSSSAPAGGASIMAGGAFTKSWTMTNQGETVWSDASGYRWAFGRGTQFGASNYYDLDPDEQIAPGGTRTFTIDGIAPATGGIYRGYWSLRRNGTNFGERVWVDVAVEPPVVAVTSTVTYVGYTTTQTAIGGTNNGWVTGLMTWSNRLTGAGGTFAAAGAWRATGIALQVGANLITIRGTNAAGIGSEDSLTIMRANLPFTDDFEDGDLAGWTLDAAGTWTNSSSSPITGLRSAKNNVSGAAGTNYLAAATYFALDGTQTVWRFNLKNGSFDPSGNNRFWVYLVASESNLKANSVCGYAVGVNLSGTDDLLKLWRVTNAGNDGTLINSGFDWNASMTIGIEVTRSAAGLWTLKYDTNGGFDNLVTGGAATDTYYTEANAFGLFFQFTSSYAGLLRWDDISITQQADEDSDADGMPDWWETTHFTNGIAAAATADADGDGMNNWQEWVAGTQPTNAGSIFAADIGATNTVGRTVTWFSTSNRNYAVYWSSNLLAGFGPLATNLTPTPPLNMYTDTVHNAEWLLYYRIGVSER